MAFWPRTPGKLGIWYDNQSDFTTAASTGSESAWTKLVCEMDGPNLADNTIDLDDVIGQPGASGGVLSGGEDGITFKLKGQLRSQLETWGSTDAIAKSPEIDLIGDFLGGASTRNYQAASVGAGTNDANTVDITSGTYTDGHFVGFGASATTVDSRGFIKTAAPLEMFEDMQGAAVSGDNGYGAVTCYPTGTQPTPKTFRMLGGEGWQDVRIVGCMPSKLTLTITTGQVIQWELEYSATQLQWDTSGTDLIAAPTHNTIPAATGTNGGRFTVDLFDTSDGTATAGDAYCDVANIVLTVDREQTRVGCPSSLEGVSNVVLGDANIMLTMDVTVKDTDISSSKTVWDNHYTSQDKFSVCFYLGETAGKMFALSVPQARVSARPTLTTIGGKLIGHGLVMKPAAYTGDTSSTAPGDTPLRLSIA